jgi:hypothetical protein
VNGEALTKLNVKRTGLKLLKGLISQVVRYRGQHGAKQRYYTNRAIDGLGIYLLLRSRTTSNKIQHYRKQLGSLLEFCNCSKTTFMKRLKIAEDIGLLTYSHHDITFIAYEKIARKYELDRVHFTQIMYDSANEMQTIRHILEGVELHENKERQHEMIKRNTSKNPLLTAALKVRFPVLQKGNFRKRLLKAQQASYRVGSGDAVLLHHFNADDNRAARTIRAAHGFKSNRSVYDLKRRLYDRQVITDWKRRIFQGKEPDWNPHAFTTWNPATGIRTTVMPDEITLNTAIYGS